MDKQITELTLNEIENVVGGTFSGNATMNANSVSTALRRNSARKRITRSLNTTHLIHTAAPPLDRLSSPSAPAPTTRRSRHS